MPDEKYLVTFEMSSSTTHEYEVSHTEFEIILALVVHRRGGSHTFGNTTIFFEHVAVFSWEKADEAGDDLQKA